MKRNLVPLLAIAFVVAAISTGLFYGLFASKLRSASLDLPPQKIVVAAHDLDKGTVLKLEDVKVEEIRARTALQGAPDSPDKVVGAAVVHAIAHDQVLTDADLAGKTAAAAGPVPQGMRAVSIHVFESNGLLGSIHPGSKVDVQAFTDKSGAMQLSPILQDIEVVSVSAQPEPTMDGRHTAPVVTVLVRPADSDVIALADSGAHLRLALRNSADGGRDGRGPVALQTLFERRERTPKPSAGAEGDARPSRGRE